MTRCRDELALDFFELGQLPDALDSSPERKIEHLIEIAIVEAAVVANGDEPLAHQFGNGLGVEIRQQERVVAFCEAFAFEGVGEPSNRHIGDREQAVKFDPKALSQLGSVLLLEFDLRWGERRSDWIVDEVEAEVGSRLAVA